MAKLTSVLIPTYNRAHTLKRAIDSVLAQRDESLECLVIDDGSTDDTLELFSGYQDSRLKLIQSEDNRGVSAARNLGFTHAQGDYIALLDSDDEWLNHKLAVQTPLLADYPLVHGEEIWIRNGRRVNPKKIHEKSGGDLFIRSLGLCLISPSASVMKRDLYEEMQGFREDFPVCEDYELWLRITQKYEVAFVSDPVINKYGGHEDQLSQKYKAMDYWRVKAMALLQSTTTLTQTQRVALEEQMLKKCLILEQGYLKHQSNQEHLSFVREQLGVLRG
jgi:glycosyltransferase involved in cell wall biosynthesis